MIDWLKISSSAAQFQLAQLLRSPTQLAIAAISAALLFSFNILITNYRILFQAPSANLISQLLIGSLVSVMPITLLLIALNSILGGLMVALLFKAITVKIATTPTLSGINRLMGATGIVASMGLPSCATCGLGLISAIGYGGVLLLLPFRGLELSVLAASFLSYSILSISNKLTNSSCKLTK